MHLGYASVLVFTTWLMMYADALAEPSLDVVQGNASLSCPAPISLSNDAVGAQLDEAGLNPETTCIYQERENYVLQENLPIDLKVPAKVESKTTDLVEGGETLASGTPVDIYLVHNDGSLGGESSVFTAARLNFETEVFGLIFFAETLRDTC